MKPDSLDQILSNLGDLEAALQRTREVDRLETEVAALKDELKTLGSHANNRLHLLAQIHEILGPDGEEETVSFSTGVQGSHWRMPARILKLLRENEELRLTATMQNVAAVAAASEANRSDSKNTYLEEVNKRLQRERDFLEDLAAQHLRNTDYYRGLLLGAAKHLGDEVYVRDDGSRFEDPLVDKVPELVGHLRQQLHHLERHVEDEHVAAWKRIQAVLLEDRPKDSDGSLVGDVIATIEQLRRENETLARQVPPEPPADAIATFTLRRVKNNAADPLSPPPGFSALELTMHCRGDGLNVRSPYFTAQLINPVSTFRNVMLHAGYALAVHLGWEPGTLEEFVTPPTPPASVFDGPRGVEMDQLAVGDRSIAAPGAFRKHLGQQWCRTTEWNFEHVMVYHGDHSYFVLCNVYRDPTTGALTYEPVAVSDLPKIP